MPNIHRTMTPEQMQLLADIFRILPKEIRTNEDKEKLAPGEMGISYQEGTFYVRDPYTGELIAPNSIEFLRPILNKYNINTGLLNADTVDYIRFYSSIHQLEQLGINLSPDSIIRQMSSPSILYSYVGYENYAQIGYPSSSGIILVYKINEQYATALYHDLTIGAVYLGHHNPETHMFEGWMCITSHDGMMITTTGGTDVQVEYGQTVDDLEIVALRVKEPVDPSASLIVDGGDPTPIWNEAGQPYGYAIPENSIIMLVYDAKNTAWIYGGSSVSPQTVLNRVMAKRLGTTSDDLVETVEEEVKKLEDTIDQKIEDMQTSIDQSVKDLTDKVNQTVDDLTQLVNDSVNELTEKVDTAVKDLNDNLNQFKEDSAQAMEDMQNTVDSTVKDLTDKVNTATETLTELVNTSITDMENHLSETMTNFQTTINQEINEFKTSVNQRVNSLENTINGLTVHAVITEFDVTVAAEGTTEYTINGFDKNTDSLSVNYGQTALRLGLDYVYSDAASNIIVLQTFTPDAGDVLHFQVTKYEVIQPSDTTGTETQP